MISFDTCISLGAFFTTIYGIFYYRRMFKSNREIQLSTPIYLEHLQTIIPKAFFDYQNDSNELKMIENFSKKIKAFQSDILYFKYTHRKIFFSVVDSLDEIENIIRKSTGHRADQTTIDAISSSLNRIYKVFFNDLPDDRIEQYFKA